MSMRFWSAPTLIVLAAASRVIPHPANVTPILAMALFAGAAFGGKTSQSAKSSQKWFAVLLPLAAMFLSDLVIGAHNQIISVYGSIILITVLGFALSQKQTVARVAGLTLLSSLLFFVVTNFAVWLTSGMYAPTTTGLIQCYTLALPFFRNGLLGDLFFSGVLFGAWALVTSLTKASDDSQLGTI